LISSTNKDKSTTIVLKTTNPYLPDRVEFKHQFVNFKAGQSMVNMERKEFGMENEKKHH
jgi:hypothetical protein